MNETAGVHLRLQQRKHCWYSLLLSLFFPLFLSSQNAQQYRFQHLGRAQGLETPKPGSIFQDSYGFIWIGTEFGLFRYDGYSFKPYHFSSANTTSLPGNHIAPHAFYEDANSDIWVATQNWGFAKFDRQTEKFQRFQHEPGKPNTVHSNDINVICGDGKGGIWIGMRGGGLDHFDPNKKQFTHCLLTDKTPTRLCSKMILSLHLAKNGELWIGHGEGLSIRDTAGRFRCYWPNKDQPASLSAKYILDIFETDDRFWLGTVNGLNSFTGSGAFARYFPEDQPDIPKGVGYNYIFRVFKDRDGDFWVGTNAGLLRFFPDRIPHFELVHHSPTDPTSIGKGGIFDIYQDNSSGLWFATKNGISVLNKNTALFNEPKLLALQRTIAQSSDDISIRDIAEAQGRFWLATEHDLFSYKNGEAVRRYAKQSYNRLLLTGDGRLLAGTVSDSLALIDAKSANVLKWQPKENILERSKNKPVGLNNTAFAIGPDGMWWLGTKRCLNRFDPNTGEYCQFYAPPLSHNCINDLHFDWEGNLWVATLGGGLSVLCPEEQSQPISNTLLHFQQIRHNPSNTISNDNVLAIFADSKKRLWFGTEEGLNLRLADGRWQRFFKKDGLPDDKITGIIEDAGGDIWFCTANHGLARYQNGRFVSFSMQDGLNTDFFTAGACLRMDDGLLVFAGDNSINSFYPQKIASCAGPLPLYFTELRLYNRVVSPGGSDGLLRQPIYQTDSIELGYHQKVITLQFAALDFIYQKNRRYRYRVQGLNTEWQYLGSQREVSLALTDILPRSYLLEVQSACQFDDWESPGRLLLIRVRPPWFLEWWMVVLYFFMFFGSIYAVYKFRVNRKLAIAETRRIQELAAAETHRLQELDAVKTRLYTNITHEFRTPLTIILGNADRLQEQLGPTASSSLKMIKRNGAQLLSLVNQMLDLAKLESGSLALNLVQGDVIEFLKYLLESFQSIAASNGIALHFEADESSFLMDYDPVRLQQIVSNLLSNAVKFTPAGGTISVRVAPAGEPAPSSLRIIVTDTGPGIPAEKIPYIFDRFYQADDSITRQGEGSGIGLTLVKELVQLLGGDITVQSTLGKGAEFSVLLPVRREAGPAPEIKFPNMDLVQLPENREATNLPAGSAADASRPSLLLIEDNPEVLQYLVAMLQKDYHLLTAVNGKLGLEKAIRESPDLIVSDVMMPEMDGYEACRRLKNTAETSHIPIVLLTAKADTESKIEGLEQGADAYLPKPFYEKELRATLENLLENRKKLRQYYRSGAFIANPEKPAGIPANPQDTLFLKTLLQAVESQIDALNFSAEKLADMLHMSYDNLYKKINRLTGMGVTEYIRHIRLHRAAALLLEQELWTVTRISREVGFDHLNFFSREFKKVFGQTPSAYRRRPGTSG